MQITNMAANNDVLMNKRFEEAFDLIKYVFKVEKLYDDQTKLIKAFCNGSNVFFNAPTGYGKSIVFQSLPWVTDVLYEQTIGFSTLIVISPLQSLMEDQCNRMKDIGISSIALYSDNAGDESILKDVREGIYSLVYASPECLLGKKIWRSILCSDEFRDHCIGIAYDEAHIISQW
jgi:superfamily II DNA helicase RecQ